MSPNVVTMLQQIHADSWFWILIFLVLSFFLFKSGKAKFANIIQMILRLVYLVMLVSGIGMLIAYNFPLTYVIKGILAILMIGVAEMILGKAKRGERTATMWIIFIVLFVLVLLLAMRILSF